MRLRSLRVWTALALALGLFVGSIAVGSADAPEGPFEVYFPWVPNGSVISDPRGFENTGPYYGTVTIQNLENQSIQLGVKATTAGNLEDFGTYSKVTLAPKASRTFSASQIGVSNPGGGAVAKAMISGTDTPARIAGIQKQAAPVVQADHARTGALHTVVDGYTGLTEDQISNVVVLPIVQTNSNWNSIIRITNLDSVATTTIEIRLYDAGGDFKSVHEVMAGPGQTVSFDLLQNDVPSGWVGSAMIGASVDIGVVVERAKNEAKLLIINAARPQDSEASTQFAPLIFRDWFDWNTGISVVNVSNLQNYVTITYYATDGTQIGTQVMELIPSGMDFVYSPAALGVDGVVAAAIITATQPFLAVVDEVKYTSLSPLQGHAMSYFVEPAAAERHEALTLPLFQMGNPDTDTGDTTGIQVFNPDDESVRVRVWIFDQGGNLVVRLPSFVLEGKQGATVYAPEIDEVPANFTGSALVGIVSGDGMLTAVSNGVNYSVPYDGSLSTNLVHVDLIWPPSPE